MRDGARISVIIPALNEEQTIGKVLDAVPGWVDEVIVADNGSTDGTADTAAAHGARVVHEPRRGYGSACLKGIDALGDPDVVVFLDGDFSDYPEQMDGLVDPILSGRADLVIGSRVRGRRAPGSFTPQARFGNRLACFLIRLFWGVAYTDLGPFRAIRRTALERLGMKDPDYGWTVEMQIKAAIHRLSSTEVPVDYRKRIGKSKVSGTLRGVVGAGYKILSTIFLSAIAYHLGKRRAAGRERLIVFTRYPEAGHCKTRLIPALGPQGAADLHRKMAERAVHTAAGVEGPSVEVHFTGAEAGAMAEWLGNSVDYRPQAEGGLGQRMAAAFRTAFEEGADKAAIIGVDCPEITPGILRGALDALKRRDLVLGPATDGGYYLVGLRSEAMGRALPALFEDLPWGTGTVFQETLDLADAQGLRVHRLTLLDDVDRPEDLPVWERALERSEDGEAVPHLSVIIPTLNESPHIRDTIALAQRAEDAEILVVDGGSDDGTLELVRDLGVTLLASPPGRARQMNLGAAKARGEVLLFLHGDTCLPEGFEQQIRAILGRPGVVAGAFRFSTDDHSRTMRFIGFWANWRSRWLGFPYGDQCLYLRKDLFRELGGFPELPMMEDFEMVRRLKKRGRVRTAPMAIVTSARRWRRAGRWRTFARNQAAVFLYLLGVSPQRIARFYRRNGGGQA